MKKIIVLFFIISGITFCAAGTLYWHIQEEEAWSEWREQGLYVVDCVVEKEKSGCSKQEIQAYGDSIESAIGRKKPSKCPYCFVKSLIR